MVPKPTLQDQEAAHGDAPGGRRLGGEAPKVLRESPHEGSATPPAVPAQRSSQRPLDGALPTLPMPSFGPLRRAGPLALSQPLRHPPGPAGMAQRRDHLYLLPNLTPHTASRSDRRLYIISRVKSPPPSPLSSKKKRSHFFEARVRLSPFDFRINPSLLTSTARLLRVE